MVEADHLYAADYHWWKHHIGDVIRDYDGRCWSCEAPGAGIWVENDAAAWNVTLLECDNSAKGLSRDAGKVHSGGNSGYQAINLALHLGATRIILLGFDMHNFGGKSHWFGEHPEEFPPGNKPERFIAAYRTINPADYGIEIINCSRQTALDAFPRCRIEDVL